MPTQTTVDLEKFKDVLGFRPVFRQWGNRRKADMRQVQTDADKSRLSLSKELIKSPEYNAIKSYFGELRQWVYGRTVPGAFKGFQFCSKEAKEAIETRMRTATTDDLPPLVAALQLAFPAQVEEARAALNGQWKASDYPTPEQLPAMFGVDWYWLDFTPAAALSPEERAAEEKKLQAKLQDAGEEIITALRTSFQELLAHAIDRLTPGADGKAKIFRDSLIGNIREFLDTFSSRNLMRDSELETLVSKAREVMTGTAGDPDRIRKYDSVKAEAAKAFGEIKAQLDAAIETRKGRSFDLDPE